MTEVSERIVLALHEATKEQLQEALDHAKRIGFSKRAAAIQREMDQREDRNP